MSRFYEDLCIVKRNIMELGEYNNPTYYLQEVGEYMVSFDRDNTGVLVQGEPQPIVSDRYIIYAPNYADIQAGDLLVINDVQYKATQPMRYRTHLEIVCTLHKEI